MATDTLFVIGLMTVVSLVWGILAVPRLRARLPTIYLITRSWWLMLAALCACYLIAKINSDNQYLDYEHPYQWLFVSFFILIGLRGSYEITRLWRSESKARLITKLQARGLQTNTLAVPIPQTSLSNKPATELTNNTQPYIYLNLLDGIFSSVFIILIISLVFLQLRLTHQVQR